MSGLMSLDALIVWAASLCTIIIYGQLFGLCASMLYQFHPLLGRRDLFEIAAVAFWSACWIWLQLLTAARGVYICQGMALAVGIALSGWGIGKFCMATLERRDIWYQFRRQEESRATAERA